MNYFKTTIVALSALAVLAASTLGFQLTEIIAEETEDKGYKFAEGTDITAVFKFRDGVELSKFEAFNQKNGFDAKDKPEFSLQKIVGKTPMLYEAADKTSKYSRNISQEFKFKFFDVQIILAQNGEILREFDYRDCQVTNYAINTRFDNEEGWTQDHGFAVTDIFEFVCDGYTPQNPQYAVMHADKKAVNISSMDLKEPFYTWSEHFKATSGGQ